MPAIQVRAPTYQNRAELLARYAQAHANLWGPLPVIELVPEPEPAPEPMPELEVAPEPAPLSVWQPRKPIWPPTTYQRVRAAIAEKYGVTVRELKSRDRTQRVVRVRHIAMYVLSRHFGYSTPQAAKRLGNRDHTTAMYAIRKVEEMIRNSPEFASEMQSVMQVCMPYG